MTTACREAKVKTAINGQLDWTFKTADTRQHVHGYHDYPARMIPQIAGQLIDLYGKDAELLFDPYCGSGTSLVEGVLRGVDSVGTDLNPLARLMSEVKTVKPSLRSIDKEIQRLQQLLEQSPMGQPIESIEGITDINFWFKPKVILKLSWLEEFIDEISTKTVRRFFRLAFSEVIRESSNTRSSEFKLYRYPPKVMETYDPDVYGLFLASILRNRKRLEEFVKLSKQSDRLGKSKVYEFNTVHGIPATKVEPESVDLVVTSPPYGDSRTTVAYGQYSRLSSAWLGLDEPHNIDNRLMGGKRIKNHDELPCAELNKSIAEITEQDKKRGAEVYAFYLDLYRSIENVATVMRKGGHACYVVGNRRVKGVTLPTDKAIASFFSEFSFEQDGAFVRSIPNKRMPHKNSPTNKPGKLDVTMTVEHIVVMRKV